MFFPSWIVFNSYDIERELKGLFKRIRKQKEFIKNDQTEKIVAKI